MSRRGPKIGATEPRVLHRVGNRLRTECRHRLSKYSVFSGRSGKPPQLDDVPPRCARPCLSAPYRKGNSGAAPNQINRIRVLLSAAATQQRLQCIYRKVFCQRARRKIGARLTRIRAQTGTRRGNPNCEETWLLRKNAPCHSTGGFFLARNPAEFGSRRERLMHLAKTTFQRTLFRPSNSLRRRIDGRNRRRSPLHHRGSAGFRSR